MPRILLVEDEEILRDAFTFILSTLPCESDTAANGETALRMCQEVAYDLILLDLMMPVMNGVVFLEKFTKTINSPSTKIIVMSNLSSSSLLDDALEYNIHRSILKSEVSPGDLVRLINKELRLLATAKT